MNWETTLQKLLELKKIYNGTEGSVSADHDRACELYGELEEIITRLIGINPVKVEAYKGHTELFNNLIAAGLLGSRTFYKHSGYGQLLSVIGKVKQQLQSPSIPRIEYSVTDLVRSLNRFRECCQYLKEPPQNEEGVQNIVWLMLRSQYDRMERESFLPKFGAKHYKPDFGIPDLRVFLEVKYIGEKTRVPQIQEEILADIPGYLHESSGYDGIIILVYDASHQLRDHKKFIEDLKSTEGIIEIIVVPGIG